MTRKTQINFDGWWFHGLFAAQKKESTPYQNRKEKKKKAVSPCSTVIRDGLSGNGRLEEKMWVAHSPL